MKKAILFTIFFFGFSHIYGQVWNLKEDSSTKKAQSYYSKFMGRPVYEFLLDDSIRGYEKMRFNDEPPGRLYSVRIRQNKQEAVEIIICKYAYLKKENFDLDWDKNLFYKEEICRLLFYKNDTVYLDVRDTSIIKK
ncbi:MAG: hypothetical protein JNL13_07865 [Chitinophagaceae bacterium]|nr:hypothetical protein [Chitinophagaceae bacterium]